MRQLRKLKIFAWRLWIAWKMGEEIQGLDPGLLKLGKIQGLDPPLLPTVNTNSEIILTLSAFSDWQFDFAHFLPTLLYLHPESCWLGPEHRLRRKVFSTSVQVVRYRSPHWYKGSVIHNHGGCYILSPTVLWSAARTIQAWFLGIYNRPF